MPGASMQQLVSACATQHCWQSKLTCFQQTLLHCGRGEVVCGAQLIKAHHSVSGHAVEKAQQTGQQFDL